MPASPIAEPYGRITRRAALGAAWLPLTMRRSFASGENLPGLKQIAAARGLYYGAAVERREIENDAGFREAVIRECAMLVPANALKWGEVEPVRGSPDFSNADYIARFAKENGLSLRGHVLAWHKNIPAWLTQALEEPSGRTIFQDHIRGEARHFQGAMESWDVVNEIVWPENGLPGGLANTWLLRALGRGFIADAFMSAKEGDPNAALIYNEGGLEYDSRQHEGRRIAVLRLLEKMKREKIPLDGLGIQAHLDAARKDFDPAIFRAFLKDVSDLDLSIIVTELDVSDAGIAGDTGARDAAVASATHDFLDAALDETAVEGVLTWGLCDRYTWMNQGRSPLQWLTGAPERRCLPLDSRLRRKLMWTAMARAFAAAPLRPSRLIGRTENRAL